MRSVLIMTRTNNLQHVNKIKTKNLKLECNTQNIQNQKYEILSTKQLPNLPSTFKHNFHCYWYYNWFIVSFENNHTLNLLYEVILINSIVKLGERYKQHLLKYSLIGFGTVKFSLLLNFSTYMLRTIIPSLIQKIII